MHAGQFVIGLVKIIRKLGRDIVRKRLFAVAATALLPGIGLLAYNELASRQQRAAEIHSQAAQAARLAASEVDRILEGARSLLVAASAIPAIVDLDTVECTRTLRRVAENLTTTGAILVIGADGKLVCDSQGTEPGVDFSERPYVMNGLAASDMIVGDYTVSKITGVAVLPVSFPLRRAGRTVGVVATGIRLDWLQNRLAERGVIGEGGAVTLADRNGTIVAREPFPDRFVGTRIPDAYQYLVRADAPGTLEIKSQDGTERIMGYRPISASTPLYVSAGLSKTEAFAEVNRVTLTSVAMVILSAILAVLAAAVVGNRFILNPIYRIVEVLEEWKRGNTTIRTGMEGRHGELGLVGTSLDNLLDQLEQRRIATELAEERRNLLARELAHRVKNTLAIVGAMARQSFKTDTEAFQGFSQRLSALGRTYDLLLAGEGSAGDIERLIRNTVGPYETGGHQRFRLDGPHCPVDAEVGLALSLIFHELSTNAMKYGALSRSEGYVSITWRIEHGKVRIVWHEQGGPPVERPLKEGFGSRLIRRAFPPQRQPQIAIDYSVEGLKFCLDYDLGVEDQPDTDS